LLIERVARTLSRWLHAMAIASHGCQSSSAHAISTPTSAPASSRPTNEVAAAAERGWDALHRYLVDLRKELLRRETPALLADVVESDWVVIGDLNRNVRERQVRDEALRQGAEGWADEALAIMGDWDFDLSAVQARVTWFHGEDDNTVPISAARRLAQRLPNCELIELEARGHRTAVGRRAIEDVLTA
jgi:pimeloyl-ACP methyl ester carboxylesterase